MNLGFHNPLALLGLLLAVLVALLYRHDARGRRRWVSTGQLWAEVFPQTTPLGRRRAVSLALQLAILALVVLAWAEPYLHAPAKTVLVIDNRGGMGSLVAPGRLEQSKRLAAAHVAAMGDRDEAAVLAVAGALRVRCGLTGSKTALLAAIDSISAGEGAECVSGAVRLARRILPPDMSGRIAVLGHTREDGAADVQGDDVLWVEDDRQIAAGPPAPPLWSVLTAAALAALTVEWRLFQRRRTE